MEDLRRNRTETYCCPSFSSDKDVVRQKSEEEGNISLCKLRWMISDKASWKKRKQVQTPLHREYETRQEHEASCVEQLRMLFH